MARLSRVVVPKVPHHVTQCGTRGQEVFFSPEDYIYYLDVAAEAMAEHGVTPWAWCLMPNHVHFVVVPKEETSLAHCFGSLHTRYSRRINSREKWRGSIWQGRFASCPLDKTHAWHAVRYVERNPVRASLVVDAWKYEWSSAAFHVGAKPSDRLLKTPNLAALSVTDWRAYLATADDDATLANLRRETMSGRPASSAAFLKKIERKTGRVLARGNPGRPVKA